MTSAPRKGFNPAKKVGSGPDNKGLSEYTITTGYATGLGCGDPVKLSSGTLVRATNGADAIGIFQGVYYKDSLGVPTWSQQWRASTTATEISAAVLDDPSATFMVLAEGPIPLVQKGDIFAMNLEDPSTATGRSQATVKTNTEIVGDVDISAMTDLATEVTGMTANDAFTIKTSQAASATTITIASNDTSVELLAALNAVDNIEAELDGDGFINITATDGYDIVVAESVGTPFADLFPTAAGTFSEVVAANAGLVKVVRVVDTTNKVLEVVLVNHSLRDDG
jgi:hypothetical protein